MSETDTAAWIAARRLAGESLAELPAALKPATEEAGYRIQADVQARLAAAGRGPRVGWKIGVTTPQMRAAFGLETPIGGAVPAGGRLENGATIRYADYVRIGIECEMAFVLGEPLGGTAAAGYGRDVQGHPLASLAWMANRLTALGSRMEAGDIVLTGSLPVVYWTAPGESVEIEIERLGALRLNVA